MASHVDFDISPSPAPPMGRPYRWAWATFILLIGLLVASQWSGTKTPSEVEGTDLPSVRQELDLAITFNQVSALAGQNPDRRTIRSEVRDLNRSQPVTNELRRLRTAAAFEARLQPQPADLEVLAKSKNAKDTSFAKLYSAKTLTRAEAQKLASTLTGGRIEDRLARVHAREKSGDFDARAGEFPAREGVMKLLVLGSFFIALVLGIVVWIAYIALRLMGSSAVRPRGHPLEPMALPDADRGALLFTGSLLILMLAPALVIPFASAIPRDLRGLLMILSAIVTTFLTMALLAGRKGGRQSVLRQLIGEKGKMGQYIAWGLFGFLANLPLLLTLALAGRTIFPNAPPPSHPVSEMLQTSPNPLLIAGLFFTAAIQAPIVEELAFRGVLAPAIARVAGGVVMGVLLSSLVFAAIHPQGIVAWLALAGVGAMCAVLTYHQRSIIPAIVMHAIHNGALLTLTLVVYS